MKKELVLAILFFSALWGLSEAIFGGVLYANRVPFSSIPLTVIGLVVLTLARGYFRQAGVATTIAACAMLYKFLNTPFFACHLLAILLLGISYDVFFSRSLIKNSSLCAAVVVYTSYTIFALLITYVFRQTYWVEGGILKVLFHIFAKGTIAAGLCAVMVPLAERGVEKLKEQISTPFELRSNLISCGTVIVATVVWFCGILAFFEQIVGAR